MTNSITTIEERVAAIGAQQKADKWSARQEASRNQEVEAERLRIERHRTNRIAAIKAQLQGMPAQIKNAAALASEADELSSMWASQVDTMANTYAQRLHAERHGGRPLRLELGSQEAHAYFHGTQIKKSLRQLALTANQRSFGQPLLDAESFAAELREEEKRLRDELSELQLIA